MPPHVQKRVTVSERTFIYKKRKKKTYCVINYLSMREIHLYFIKKN